MAAVAALGLTQVAVSPEDGGSADLVRGLQYIKEKRHHNVGGSGKSVAVMALARLKAIW